MQIAQKQICLQVQSWCSTINGNGLLWPGMGTTFARTGPTSEEGPSDSGSVFVLLFIVLFSFVVIFFLLGTGDIRRVQGFLLFFLTKSRTVKYQ